MVKRRSETRGPLGKEMKKFQKSEKNEKSEKSKKSERSEENQVNLGNEAVTSDDKEELLSEQGKTFVKEELKRYESKRSAILSCLYRIQKENQNWIPPEAVSYLSELMDLPEAWIQEVLSFYNLFNKKFRGKYHIQVCGNISCYMNGSEDLMNHICKKFGIKKDEDVSQDGRFSLSLVECLGSCDKAPVMQVNETYYENLTPEKAVSLLRKMED